MEQNILLIPDGVKRIEDSAYINGKFEVVSFPDSLEEIGSKAFSGCANVKVFVLPDGVKRIERYAFSGTKAVVFVPRTIQYVGEEAFDYDVEAYFECAEEDFEGFKQSYYVECDHPFSFYGYGGGGSWEQVYYYRSRSKVHFNVSRQNFLEQFKDIVDV